MIKLTRLPLLRPTKAMLHQQFSVSGTLGYLDLQAIESGYELFFGEGSREYDAMLKAVSNACEGKTEEELKHTQADLHAQVEDCKRKYENVSAYCESADRVIEEFRTKLREMTSCCDAAVREKQDIQIRHDALAKALKFEEQETARLSVALNLEQKEHDTTKEKLANTVQYNEALVQKLAALTTAIDKQIAAEYKDFQDPTRVLSVLQRIRNESE